MIGNIIDESAARRAIDAKTKPLGALGRLEDVAVRLAVLQNSLSPRVDATRVCVFGSDNGVTIEGVSAYPREVTAEMMRNFDRGGAAINVIATSNDVSLEVIDVGVDADLSALARITHDKVRCGTGNILVEPAMTHQDLNAALSVGARAARRAAADGVQALGLGEMGIGNTTTAATLLALLSGRSATETAGRGTGVSDTVLQRKQDVIEQACALHRAGIDGQHDGRELLRRCGGLDIAAIAGAAIEAARLDVAVVVDGFISTVAVLCALRIAAQEKSDDLDNLTNALFFAHRSAERGHALALECCAEQIGREVCPLLELEMPLGEGSGAALAMPILRAAAAIMRDMATFESAGVSGGERSEAHGITGDGPVNV